VNLSRDEKDFSRPSCKIILRHSAEGSVRHITFDPRQNSGLITFQYVADMPYILLLCHQFVPVQSYNSDYMVYLSQ
jgi:hypothetical protein